MRSFGSSICSALLVLLLVSQTACTPTTTRATIQSQLKQTDSVWAHMVAAPFRGDLSKFANAPVNRLHFTYEPENQKVSGTAEILFTNNSDHPLPTLYMRTWAKFWGPGTSDEFAMTDLKVDGKPADFTVGETLITIPLAKPLERGQSARLTYAATVFLPPVSLARGGEFDLTTNVGVYGAGADFTGVGGFPTVLPRGDEGKEFDTPPKDRYMDNGEYTLDEYWVTIPQEWTAIAFGTILDETPAKDGKKTVHMAGIGGGGSTNLFVTKTALKQSQQVGDIQITTYVPPFYAAYADALMKNAADALRVYQKAYGPMGLPKLDVVAMPLKSVGGMYMNGILAVASTNLTDYRSSAPDSVPPALRPLFEGDAALAVRKVTFHEVAHAWWGGLVSPDAETLPWFHEALANAATLYAFEQADGAAAGDYQRTKMAYPYQRQRILGMADAPLTWPMEQYRDQTQRTTLTYYKGALFYDRLRKQVGDEKFNAAMRAYLTKHALDIVPDPGLVAELMTEPGVEALYRRWVQEAHGDEDIGLLELHDPVLRKQLGLPPE